MGAVGSEAAGLDVGVQVGATDTQRPAELSSLEPILLDGAETEPPRFIVISQATTEIHTHQALRRIPVSGSLGHCFSLRHEPDGNAGALPAGVLDGGSGLVGWTATGGAGS